MTDFSGMPTRVRDIIIAVAAEHHIKPGDILGPSATRVNSRARWVAYARVMSEVSIRGQAPSLPQMGVWFNRDHTTVLYGLRRHASNMQWTKIRRPDSYKFGRQRMVAPLRLQLVADMAQADA